MLIRTGDQVEVMVGADRGERSRVVAVDHRTHKALVEGVARVYKHVKRSQQNPQGGRLSMEMPISTTNLMVICESCGKPSRMGARYLKDGSKERYCKKCGSSTGSLAPAKAAYVK